ncbi:hypothetical protein HS088_TW09G01414 [Tripterygium wilfordii]|uniref:FBD domain-containing protein n=1 Tax=Tripterygium wilfordii TaxID=458696 RepID=A0A7J7DBA4_TRIWF|nr:hypothetical protein HS088_TW09G01414 [Tripterygium wilfordii]
MEIQAQHTGNAKKQQIGRWASTIASRAQAFPEFTLECLKVVEFVGFAGHTNDVELVSYLIKIAVNLEKMIIVPHGPSSITSWWNHGDENNLRIARALAKQLQDRFSLGDKLVLA